MFFDFSKRLLLYTLVLIVLFSLMVIGALDLNQELVRRDQSELLDQARLVAGIFPLGEKTQDQDELNRRCRKIADITRSHVMIVEKNGFTASDQLDEKGRSPHTGGAEIAGAFAGRAESLVRQEPATGITTIYAAVPLPGTKPAALELWRQQDRDPIFSFFMIASAALVVLFLLIVVLLEGYLRAALFPSFARFRAAMHEGAVSDIPLVRQPPHKDPLAPLYSSLEELTHAWRLRAGLLESSVRELEALFDSMNEAVMVLDADDVVLRANRAAKELFKLESLSLGGRPVLQELRCVDLDRFVENLRAEQGSSPELVMYRRGDDLIDLAVTGMAIEGDDPKAGRLLLVFRDRTRMEQLERTRREFVSNVSHELKTPVTTIRGFVEALQSGSVDDPAEVSEFLSIISRQVSRLSSIIEDLLKLSEIESTQGSLEKSLRALRPILQQAVEIALETHTGPEVAVDLECPEDLELLLNANLIEEAVGNLLANAIRYCGEDRRVTLKAESREEEVRISVSDHGCGIPKEHLSRIFERFYRADEGRDRGKGGTGLGLAIVKHIAKAHGGSVVVESEPGRGSTFSIDLPYSGL